MPCVNDATFPWKCGLYNFCTHSWKVLYYILELASQEIILINLLAKLITFLYEGLEFLVKNPAYLLS